MANIKSQIKRNLTNAKRAQYRYSEQEQQKLDVSGRQYYVNLRYKF